MPPADKTERRFQPTDQALFAHLSGDTNPMHMDALAARRTQAGAPVVHGIHAVLWALDSLARSTDLSGLSHITVALNRFILLDRPIALRVTSHTTEAIAADILSEDIAMLSLRLKCTQRGGGEAQDAFLTLPPADLRCAETEPEALRGKEAWLDPAPGASGMADAFPDLTRAIGAARVTGLALLSTLVGMACPGLHSIFTAFQAELLDTVPARAGIGFRVTLADPRFRIARMAVAGNGLRATVSALVRMPPAELPGMAALTGLVAPGTFAGQRVLIAGASRGLGALSARLIASGGGGVILTHARGAADAAAVAADIRAHRSDAACDVLPLDVTRDLTDQLAALEGPITALLYYPTPHIRRQKAAVFVPALHEEFLRYYVHGFAALTASLLARGGEAKLAVLYPSSVAVAARPENMTEYAMAKAAGEVLAADLAAADPRLRMVINRLPGLPTDQNATMVRQETEDPVATLLPLLRETVLG